MIPIAKLNIDDDTIAAVVEILKSGNWASGEKVKQFEDAFAETTGARHAIAVSNGTVALQAALHAANLPKESLIVTTPFTFIATSATIVHAGHIPLFVDINAQSFNLDVEKFEFAVRKHKPKAALVVHLFGNPCEIEKIRQICEEHDVLLIEDCAQAQGAVFQGKHVGTFGKIGTHSFYATKNLPVGEGGMVLTSCDETAQAIRRYINHGRREGYDHVEVGFNYRLTNIAATIGLGQLQRLKANNERRRQIARFYVSNMNNKKVTLPVEQFDGEHVFHQFTIRTKDRSLLQSHLKERGIASAIVYPKLSYQQTAFAGKKYLTEDCRTAENTVNEVLSLPMNPYLLDSEIAQVVQSINAWKSPAVSTVI